MGCVGCACAHFSGRHEQKLGGEEDYNMDENEAESETDKQAALAGNNRNLNGKRPAEAVGLPRVSHCGPLFSLAVTKH